MAGTGEPAPGPARCSRHGDPATGACPRCGGFVCEACLSPEGPNCPACREREGPRAPRPGSPWLTFWTRPRPTIRWLLEQRPLIDSRVLGLAAAGGLATGLSRLASMEGRISGGPLLGSVLLGLLCVLVGFAQVFGLGGVLHLTCRALGGTGTLRETWCAVAWTRLTAIAGIPLSLLEIASKYAPALGESLRLVLPIANLSLTIVGLVISLAAIAEAQRFSVAKALLSLLLAAALVAIPLLIVFGSLVARVQP